MFIKIIYNAAIVDMKIKLDNHDLFRNTEIFEKRLKFSKEHRKKVLQTLVDTFGKYFIA